MIEGTTDIDVQALEEAVRYGDGYNSSHPTIEHFWEVVHGFSAQQRRQLLEFVTASERVPVSGLEGLQFTVMRNGPDTEVSNLCGFFFSLSPSENRGLLKRWLIATCSVYLRATRASDDFSSPNTPRWRGYERS